MAIHLLLLVLSSEFQMPVSGFSMSCWAGVKSCHFGPDVGFADANIGADAFCAGGLALLDGSAACCVQATDNSVAARHNETPASTDCGVLDR